MEKASIALGFAAIMISVAVVALGYGVYRAWAWVEDLWSSWNE